MSGISHIGDWMTQCERCGWGVVVEGRRFCGNNAVESIGPDQSVRACEGFRAGEPRVERGRGAPAPRAGVGRERRRGREGGGFLKLVR